MGLRTALIAALLVSPAHATEPAAAPAAPATPAAVAASPFTLTADVRSEYLHGQPMLVRVGIRNTSAETREFPDLAARPHLVRFDLQLPNGKKQSRYNTPPAEESAATWRLAAGTERDVLLAVPSGGALAAGDYQLVVTVDTADLHLELAPRPFRVAAARPVAADGPWVPGLVEKVGLQTAWVHQGKDGRHLWLHHADGRDPRTMVANYDLTALPDGVTPLISTAQPTQAWSRHIVWSQGERTIGYVQLEGPSRPVQRRAFDAPWPGTRLLGGGATDPKGGLHLPIWLPAPKGENGEVRVVSVHGARPPTYRAVAVLAKAPDRVATAVDGGGAMRLALHHSGRIDLYTVDTAMDATLPAKGTKIASPEGATALFSRFATLPTTDTTRGGLALFILDVTGAEDARQIVPRWVSLAADPLRTLPAVALPAGATVLDAIPVGAEGWTMLLRQANGGLATWSAGQAAPVAIKAGGDPALVLDANGQPWLRSTTPNAVLQWQPLGATPAR